MFEALTGELDDELGTFFDDASVLFDEQFVELGDEFPSPGDDEFDESNADVPLRAVTGASGPDGALLAGDVVAGDLEPAASASFTVVAVAGEGYIGAQTLDGSDLTITVLDAVTGDELDFSDDFVGTDPEVFVVAEEGQVLTVEVAGFGDDDVATSSSTTRSSP